MIHVYHGNGKGKTTAAIGLAIRQIGAEKQVAFAQFLKDSSSSEVVILKQLHINYMHTVMPKCFFKDMSKQEQEDLRQSCQQVLQTVFELTSDCIILDEILDAITLGLLQEADVLALLRKHAQKEIVITGRNPSKEMLAQSDYCSECVVVKHPFQNGVKARKGVEF